MPMPHKATSVSRTSVSRVGDVFVEKYDLLLQWALRLTRRDHERAEDLLHEAFLQFSLRQHDLTGIENLDGYLYSVLKHLHLALIRRAKRDPLSQVSVVEFDSVALALRASQDLDQIEMQNDLRRICAFLCWRKALAKSASYLILRFFHGYYPEEIAQIAITSRSVVDHGIRLASVEAKTHLSESRQLHVVSHRGRSHRHTSATHGHEEMPTFVSALFAVPVAEFLQSIQELIKANRTDACLPRQELLSRYREAAANATPLDRTLLAHLVSCPSCLDTMNFHLRIPPMSDRFPGERLGRFRPGGDTGAPSVSGQRDDSSNGGEMSRSEKNWTKERFLKSAKARLRESFEHQPKRLLVAVNGDTKATEDVTSGHSNLSLRLPSDTAVGFVEVLSEQGLRLAFISVMSLPPEGPDILFQTVSLSAGRSLEITLEFTSSGPVIEVTYRDPLLAHSAGPIDVEEDADVALTTKASDRVRRTFFAQLDEGRAVFSALLRERAGEWMSAYRPLVLSGAMLVLLAAAGMFYVGHLRNNAAEAQKLLSETAHVEELQIPPGRIVHRVLSYEIASQDKSEAPERAVVEMWKASDGRQTVRLSSGSGELRSEIWKSGDHSYFLDHQHHALLPLKALETLRQAVETGATDSLWMSEPAASSFEALTYLPGEEKLTGSGSEYVVKYRPASSPRNSDRPHLVYATLTIRGGRRAVAQSLWIESSGAVRCYSLTETDYSERVATDADSSVFTPNVTPPEPHASLRLSQPAAPEDPNAVLHLHLQALALLNHVDADSGEQIHVERTSAGRLSIRGTFASDERLREAKQKLSALAHNPLVEISLVSLSGKGSQPVRFEAAPATTAVKSIDVDAITTPAQERLRKYFSQRGFTHGEVDTQIQRFCEVSLRDASRSVQHAWAMHELATSFSADDWQHLSAQERQQWLSLYQGHAADLGAGLRGVHHSLAVLSPDAAGAVMAPRAVGPEDTPYSPQEQAPLRLLTDRLLGQSKLADHVLGQAVTASGHSPQDLESLCRQLQSSLAGAEQALQEIEHRAAVTGRL